jgi:diguanylate cyclase (GGDEF)-like protein
MLVVGALIFAAIFAAGWLLWWQALLRRERRALARSFQVVEEDKRILALVARGASLREVLDTLTQSIERIASDCLCTILLLDPDGRHLLKGAGPSLPPEYMDAIDGLEIGPEVGACGSAAFLNETAIVEDVATDHRFALAKGLLLGFGLRACWSVPIRNSRGAVLGTFAMYHRQPSKPRDLELRLVEAAAHLAGNAIERLRDEQRLADIAARLNLAEQAASFGIWEVDIPDRVVTLSTGLASLIGWSGTPERIALRELLPLLHPDDRERIDAAVADAAVTAQLRVEFRVVLLGGRLLWLRGEGQVEIENGVPKRAVGALIDVTEERHLLASLEEARVAAEAATVAARQATVAARQAESVEQDRRSFLELVARDEPLDGILQALANAVSQHLPRGSGSSVQLELPDGSRIAGSSPMSDGVVRFLEQVPIGSVPQTGAEQPLAGLPLKSFEQQSSGAFAESPFATYCAVPIVRQTRTTGVIIALLPPDAAMSSGDHRLIESWGQFASLAVERSLLFESLSHRAHHDTLSGLLNRASLFDQLGDEIGKAKRSGTSVGVLYLDLDQFKAINDTHGHSAGDEVLREVSRRIGGNIRRSDLAARLGGDEFVVILPGVGEPEEATRVGESILRALAEPIVFNDTPLRASASLGISIFPRDGASPEALLNVADEAMYRAKTGAGVRHFLPPSVLPRSA